MPGTALQARGVHAEWLEQAFVEVVLKGHAGGIGNNFCCPFVAGRRVNAAVFHRALGVARIKIHARGMCQEMSQGGTFRAGGLV